MKNCSFGVKQHSQQYFGDGQFYWWGNKEYMEKTTDLPQITDKRYHTNMYWLIYFHFLLSVSLKCCFSGI